jgi:hypothetical protein
MTTKTNDSLSQMGRQTHISSAIFIPNYHIIASFLSIIETLLIMDV